MGRQQPTGRHPNQTGSRGGKHTRIAGRHKRADCLFRVEAHDRWVCEAKKPAEALDSRHAYQAKRYAWNKGLPLAVLTDFEELKIFIVGGKPQLEDADFGLWKNWHYRQFPLIARELWDLLSRQSVADGSIDRLLDTLPKRPRSRGKARQLYLLKPDRSRSLDADFLNFLDQVRRGLASDLYKHNDHVFLLEADRLNEATQHILDRLLFLRICEDREIDTGIRLDSILGAWRNGHRDRRDHRPSRHWLQEEPPGPFGGTGLAAPKDSL